MSDRAPDPVDLVWYSQGGSPEMSKREQKGPGRVSQADIQKTQRPIARKECGFSRNGEVTCVTGGESEGLNREESLPGWASLKGCRTIS